MVYHLGDVGFGSLQEVKGLVERFNGTKILLRGNVSCDVVDYTPVSIESIKDSKIMLH